MQKINYYNPVESPCVSQSPCQNGGRCIYSSSSDSGYRCRCMTHYYGTNCSKGKVSPVIYYFMVEVHHCTKSLHKTLKQFDLGS